MQDIANEMVAYLDYYGSRDISLEAKENGGFEL
jgi:hypothetical protein